MTWIKVLDGTYRKLEDYSKLTVYGSGTEWKVGNLTTADIIAEFQTEAEAEEALGKLVRLSGVIDISS